MMSVPQALDTAWKYYQAGQMQQAEQLYLQILQEHPNHVDALHLLGLIAGQTGRYDLAADYLMTTVRLKPDFAAAHNNLGNVFILQGKLQEAVDSFRRAVSSKPGFADAHCNLGNALREQGHLDEAVASLREALRLRPDSAPAHNNLGSAFQQKGQLVEAEGSLRQALRLKPDYVDASYNLGIVLSAQRRLDEAVVQYQETLRLKPDHVEAYLNLGNVCKDQGRLDDALAAYRAALRIKPDAAHIHSNLVLALNYHPDYDARAIQEAYARWSQQHAEPLKKLIRACANRPDPERRLRIAYVSPDFCDHPVGHNIWPLLRNHDHDQVEITLYANVNDADTMTELFRKRADRWCCITGWPDEKVAQRIRQDGIDILVDLALHTSGNRLLVFARKPAPVQVTFAGYPGSTGLSLIDYRLTDPYLNPPGLTDAFYAEESIRLPDTFWCYEPGIDQPLVNDLPALKSGVITLGCLNNFCKVNDGCLVLWAKVLRAVPQSRLLLLVPPGRARDQVLARLEEQGVAAERAEFAHRLPRAAYLRRYHQIDLGLDTLPYNGHTTSLDAFWMGVPVLTLVGKTVVGRAGWSQLSNLGLQELAAETPEQFVALAARVAADLPRLQELRATLRERMHQSPLMDGKRFARNVEQAFRQMWRRWCEQPRD